MTCGQSHSGQSFPQRLVMQNPNYDRKVIKDRRPKMKSLKRKAKPIKWL